MAPIALQLGGEPASDESRAEAMIQVPGLATDDAAVVKPGSAGMRHLPDGGGPDAYTLRCFQRGNRVVDEDLSGFRLATGTPALVATQAVGRQITIVAVGTGLCIATTDRGQAPHSIERLEKSR